MEITKVVVIGILLVLLILIIITLLVMVFPVLAGGKNKKESIDKNKVKEQEQIKQTVSVKGSIAKTDDYTLISILTAAIAAYRSASGESADTSGFRVVAFRKTPLKRSSK